MTDQGKSVMECVIFCKSLVMIISYLQECTARNDVAPVAVLGSINPSYCKSSAITKIILGIIVATFVASFVVLSSLASSFCLLTYLDRD